MTVKSFQELSHYNLNVTWAADVNKGASVGVVDPDNSTGDPSSYPSNLTTSIVDNILPRPALEEYKALPQLQVSVLPGSIPDVTTPTTPGRLPGSFPEVSTHNECAISDEVVSNIVNMIKSIWPNPSTTACQEAPEFCTLYMKNKAWNLPNFLGARIPLKSNLIIPTWEKYLTDYHDKLLCQFLTYGWPVGYNANTPPKSVESNHASAEKHLSHVKKFLDVEISHNALVGPFSRAPFTPWCRVSPLMTRDKKDTDQKRIIVDLSFPKDESVNDAIDPSYHLGKDVTYTLPMIAD